MPSIHLPTLNAFLNGSAGLFLFLGWIAIKRGRPDLHKRLMIAAMIASSLFLCSYITYHYQTHGQPTRYQREGFLRYLYRTILLTHTPLAMIILPASIMAVRHALKGNLAKHVRITKWLYPVWVYVSVTGILIYLMLYIF